MSENKFYQITNRILAEANRESPESIDLYLIGSRACSYPAFRQEFAKIAQGPDAQSPETGQATAAAYVNALFMQNEDSEIADTLQLFNARSLETLQAGNKVGYVLHEELPDAYIMSDRSKGPVYRHVLLNYRQQKPVMLQAVIPINPLFVMRKTVQNLRNGYVDKQTRLKFAPVFMESIYPAIEQTTKPERDCLLDVYQPLGYIVDAALFSPLLEDNHTSIVQTWRKTLIEISKESDARAAEIFHRAKMKTSSRHVIVQEIDKKMSPLNLQFADYIDSVASAYYRRDSRKTIGEVVDSLAYT